MTKPAACVSRSQDDAFRIIHRARNASSGFSFSEFIHLRSTDTANVE
jgi:hypothetical protein